MQRLVSNATLIKFETIFQGTANGQHIFLSKAYWSDGVAMYQVEYELDERVRWESFATFRDAYIAYITLLDTYLGQTD